MRASVCEEYEKTEVEQQAGEGVDVLRNVGVGEKAHFERRHHDQHRRDHVSARKLVKACPLTHGLRKQFQCRRRVTVSRVIETQARQGGAPLRKQVNQLT